jgi:ribonuclease HII
VTISKTFIDNNIVDEINILQATFKAMHNCLDDLRVPFDHIIVDGDKFKKYNTIPHHCIIKGDDKYMSIAAASILAKVERDEYMVELSRDSRNIQYGWDKNVGYGTQQHTNAICEFGITEYHRRTFLKNLLSR